MPLIPASFPFARYLGLGDFSDLYFEDAHTLSLKWEDGRIQAVSDSSERGVGWRVLNGTETRYAHIDLSGKNDLDVLDSFRKGLMHGLSERPVTIAAVPAPKTHRIRISPQQKSLEEKIRLVEEAFKAAQISPLIKQVSINYGEKEKKIEYVSSSGAFAEDRVYTTISVHVTAERNGDMQSAYEAAGGLIGFELFEKVSVSALAKLVAERALKKLDAPKAPVGEMPVIIAAEAGGTLIHEAVGHSLEADAVLEGTSPSYRGKLGTVVGNEKLTVLDDPTVPSARGSFHFDDEGTPSERTVLIENGVLKTLLYDRKSAMQSGRASNGHGRRESYAHRPIPRMSNTMIAAGHDNPDEIRRSLQNGFLVTRMGGGQVNTANGDFVFDVEEGFQIKDGKATMVRGAALLGNGPDVLKNIDMVGSDLGWGIGTCGKEGQGVPVGDAIPTIRVKKLVIGGQA
jgi:TldD protein